MARFVAFELGHGPAGVLSPARLESAFSGFAATSADLEEGYGLGFTAMRRDTFAWVGHSGGVAGYVAYMYFDRRTQIGVVLFRNVQGGKEDPGRLATDILSRLVEARIAAAAAAFAKRFKDQTPVVGSDAALRRMIGELRLGKPDYELMSSELALAIRQQLTQTQARLASLGELESLTFKGVGPGGADIYTAKFEHGALEYRIWLTEDGRIANANDRPPSSR
jgi:CubicO group peptidase (beta-lactamase class C family)